MEVCPPDTLLTCRLFVCVPDFAVGEERSHFLSEHVTPPFLETGELQGCGKVDSVEDGRAVSGLHPWEWPSRRVATWAWCLSSHCLCGEERVQLTQSAAT